MRSTPSGPTGAERVPDRGLMTMTLGDWVSYWHLIPQGPKCWHERPASYFARKNSELGARLGRQPLRSSVVTVAPRIGRLAEECQQ